MVHIGAQPGVLRRGDAEHLSGAHVAGYGQLPGVKVQRHEVVVVAQRKAQAYEGFFVAQARSQLLRQGAHFRLAVKLCLEGRSAVPLYVLHQLTACRQRIVVAPGLAALLQVCRVRPVKLPARARLAPAVGGAVVQLPGDVGSHGGAELHAKAGGGGALTGEHLAREGVFVKLQAQKHARERQKHQRQRRERGEGVSFSLQLQHPPCSLSGLARQSSSPSSVIARLILSAR